MFLIVSSLKDIASQNIKSHLVDLLNPDKRKVGGFTIYEADDIIIAEIQERAIYADYLDKKLMKELNTDFKEMLFASRHYSKDGRNIFTTHVSGNIATADYGGNPFSLAKPATIRMKNYVLALKDKLTRKKEFEFTMEVTHHGPSEIATPSAFFEIGSTENAWRDEDAGKIVAEAMVESIRDTRNDWNIAVGVGGTHYAPRQTEIMLETTFTFGHDFAKYTFKDLSSEFLKKAIEISEANFLVIDEKSTTAKIKKLVLDVADEVGLKMLKSKEVKTHYPLNSKSS